MHRKLILMSLMGKTAREMSIVPSALSYPHAPHAACALRSACPAPPLRPTAPPSARPCAAAPPACAAALPHLLGEGRPRQRPRRVRPPTWRSSTPRRWPPAHPAARAWEWDAGRPLCKVRVSPKLHLGLPALMFFVNIIAQITHSIMA